MTTLEIPDFSLVVLIGAAGSGKTTFARRHFRPTEVISSDYCRGLLCDDEGDQSVTEPAFEVLHFIAGRRLAGGRLTVIDATSVQRNARRPLIRLARDHHAAPVAIIFNLPVGVCLERDRNRPDRGVGPRIIRLQAEALRRTLSDLSRDGFRHVHVLNSVAEVEAAVIARRPIPSRRREEHGPFDILGDVHGCFHEVAALLERVGYAVHQDGGRVQVTPPPGRKVIFLGDLVDRGPRIADVLRLAMHMTKSGAALCVAGNHDAKLLQKLRGREVQVSHGLAHSLEQLGRETPLFRSQVADFIEGLTHHYSLDDGRLVVAHAGMKEAMQGRDSAAVRGFALYGETSGETDEFGLPVRHNWAEQYHGRAAVVYGHTPVEQPEWLNRTINIDTGCVFGGRLTALRYPEEELVSVSAARAYYPLARPLQSPHPMP